jgi:hypothetical protein
MKSLFFFSFSVVLYWTKQIFNREKKELCNETGCKYIVLEKTPPSFTPVSTTLILNSIRAPEKVCLPFYFFRIFV